MSKSIRMSLYTCLLASMSGCAGKGSDALAQKLQNALKSGDMDTAAALLDSRGVSAENQFFYLDLVNDCFEKLPCQVSVGPLTADFTKRAAKQRETQGLELPVAPEGLIKVSGESADKKERMAMEMPYAKIDGQYKIIASSYTPAKLKELKAKSAQAVADEFLAVGIKGDKGWKAKASVLPAGGGAAGAALVAYDNTLAVAAKANNPDAMVAALGYFGKIVYGDKDYNGKPVSLKRRQLKLRAQAMRFDYDAKVLGGYALDDVYALTYEARDGAGWIVRGCAVGEFKDGKWQPMGTETVAVPPG